MLEAVFTIINKEHNNRVAYTIENAYIRVYSGLPDSICYSRRRWVWYDRPWYGLQYEQEPMNHALHTVIG